MRVRAWKPNAVVKNAIDPGASFRCVCERIPPPVRCGVAGRRKTGCDFGDAAARAECRRPARRA